VEPVRLVCADGTALAGHFWQGETAARGTVIVNPATGVLARYYHRYARFLAGHGFAAITYDYRGIGLSRPGRLRGSAIRWRDWGERDFAAVVAWARARDPRGFLGVVGHSIGGFLPGYAANAPAVDRMLTMGAQFAYWPDYARRARLAMLLRWHALMPALTLAAGYFPGRRLGWLEDLPAGVALEWAFRGPRVETSYPPADQAPLLARFAAFRAPILAIGLTDDPFGTIAAIRRGLGYYRGAERVQVALRPAELGHDAIGHFGLFHSRHEAGFWQATLAWLRDGTNPWPQAVV
jgi:predicted alpha/beta hydrolase